MVFALLVLMLLAAVLLVWRAGRRKELPGPPSDPGAEQ